MFYEIYCDLCQKNGLTPSGAAGKIGFNRASVTMWKNTGKAPKQELLVKIADYFDVSVGYLLGTEEQKEKSRTDHSHHTAPKDILDEADIAFYDGYKELTEDDKETVRDMVRVMRERRAKK